MTRQALAIFLLIFSGLVYSHNSFAQVALRDTVINWQHHQFELNDDHSIKSFSTNDNDIQQVTFSSGKVLENELIRLVLLPEYGGRVLSFVYKPTGHEYLYQSECGSAYGIGDGNFYYNWLMVYGGIFPTFPEPEHGKTWLLPWDYSVIKQTADTITVRMQYKDSTAFAGAPGQFNNGITNITCQVDVSIYSGSSLWDFDVKIINNEAVPKTYEYWTCTTLAPGSQPGDTGTPLNSEMIIPVEQYFAGWSPGGWIGNFNSYYDFERINYLSEWNNMGIAYSHNLDKMYWGVINHDNEEGIFRISDNIETFGTKVWTWGKNNVNNNLYDYSNGGADNYIELWAGTSKSFFTDAQLQANEVKSWLEAYYPTTGMTSIDNMNRTAAVNMVWDEEQSNLDLQLNTFSSEQSFYQKVYIDDVVDYIISEENISFSALGHFNDFDLSAADLAAGTYLLRYELYDNDNLLVLEHSELIEVSPVLAVNHEDLNNINMMMLAPRRLQLQLSQPGTFYTQIVTTDGRLIDESSFTGNDVILDFPKGGVYIIRLLSASKSFSRKVYID